MGRENEEAKVFTDNLDRLLSGQDIQVGADMDEELRTTLEFAQKMTALRPEPSPQFQSNLKARLTQKISEQEANNRRGWFWKLVPHEPIWQAAIATAVIFIVVGVIWGTLFRPSGQTPIVIAPTTTQATATQPASTTASTTVTTPASGTYLIASANTDKGVYYSGDQVNIRLSLQNVTNGNFNLEKYPPVLSLMQASDNQPVYTFPAGSSQLTLAPGDTVSINLAWDQHDAKGRTVPDGCYYLELEDLDFQGAALKMNLSSPVYFEIESTSTGSQGTGRLFNVNQSQTVNNITVVLQKVELVNSGMLVTVTTSVPADYVLLPATPTSQASKNYQASAGYAIDGNWIQDIGLSRVEYFADSMNNTWFIAATISDDAREMTFIVNSVGDQMGPWIFKVPLK